jgi:Clr5 domain
MTDLTFSEPTTIAAATFARQACRTEWDRLRPVIKRLYVDEDRTLNEVMTIMARDHGHRAT